ncbi:alpha/beta hydrolase fold domain-containing protein [uncultured Nocardioides sp.]|uniref:alpha/beta hydrolase fold domain-containing protein n=1 Tax=uncultured Nocardioides sp. TaxID=198441 RepID=UPI00261E7891|nr:alpha/beta hydrolase fold domain-containing protein [uncultured Nocardioides sp.]
MTAPFHPDLARARFIPRFSVTPRLVRLLDRLPTRPAARTPPSVVATEVRVSDTASFRLLRPAGVEGPLPCLLWLHGGGHLAGSPEQDDAQNIAFVERLGIGVAALRYRLGSAAPYPASTDDAYAGLRALVERAEELGVDTTRLAVGGSSAGGGLAAALVLLAHDRGEVDVAFQLLTYPMLDDRTAARPVDDRRTRVWSAGSNRLGWSTYLGTAPGSPDVSPYAAPARRKDLSGLPPAWIGVGDLDLFHAEDLAHARRLRAAGVDCEVTEVPGAFHGFDVLFAKAPVSRRFRDAQVLALHRAGITTQ